jgi:hypothetical protein
MAAALGLHLVFDVHSRRAELDQRLDRARDVEGAAEAGIASTSSGRLADIGNAAHVGEHVVERADAKVGHAERPGATPPPTGRSRG